MNYADVYREIEQGTAAARLPGMVMDELTEVAEGHRDLAAVRHPLGFVCLPLQREGEFGICVHAWPCDLPAPRRADGPQDSEESADSEVSEDAEDSEDTGDDAVAAPDPVLTTSPMHSHSWDLLSFVLYGEVHNQLVHVDEASVHPTHQLCEVRSSGDADEIRPTGRTVRWTPGPAQATAAGESYRLAAGEFHMTVVPEQTPAATVVLGRGRSDAVDLSLGSLNTRTHRVPRQRCAHRDTVRAASLVASRIADKMTKSG